LRIYLITA